MRSFLPEEIQDWQLQDSSATYDRTTLFSYINGAAEVFLAYDYRSLSVFRYVRPDHPEITVELFGMGSPEEAYGIFSHSREKEEVGIGRGYDYRPGLLCFWQDQYFVCAGTAGPAAKTEAVLFDLATMISDRLPKGGAAPAIVTSLPEDGMVPGSVRYFHTHTSLNVHYYLHSENILNLGSETGCVLARYNAGYLLCVRYPSPAAAKRGHGGLVREYAPGLAEHEVAETAVGNWLAARLRGPLLIVVFEAEREAAALALVTACENSMSSTRTKEVSP